MTMRPRPMHNDLGDFSRCASVDEERLLTLYRSSTWEDRTAMLFRLCRIHYAPFFAESFSRREDADDTSYLHEELESALRSICPREHFVELETTLHEPYFSLLWKSAWGDIAPIILGASEQDGQRADELYKAVLAHCSHDWRRPVTFQRKHALALIEDWREAALQAIFSVQK